MKRLLTLLIILGIYTSAQGQSFYTVSNVLCNGDASGCIHIDTTFSFPWGTPPYSYQLLGTIIGNYQNGQFCGLPAGAYTLEVTDANNTSNNYVVTINEPVLLTLNISSTTNVRCNGGNDGIVVVTGTGGTGVLNYTMTPVQTQAPVGTFSNLSAGTYIATATDANGCYSTTIATITEPIALLQITNITSTTPSCSPGNDATATITASGGTGFLQYKVGPWPNYQASNVITGLPSGSMLATVLDGNGCMDTATVNILGPTAPYINYLIVDNVSCNGNADGAIQITGSGGTPPLQYSAIPSITQLSPGSFTGLGAGVYTVGVTDANNCMIQTTAVINEPPALTMGTPIITNAICNTNNGSITTNAQGGTPAYTFAISSPGTQTVPGSFSNLPTGNYTITVTDVNACTSVTAVSVNGISSISINNLSSAPPVCVGDSNGWISVSASGSGPISYSMISPLSYAQTNATGYFSNLPMGNYVIEVTDTNNCPELVEIFLGPGGVDIQNITSSSIPCVDTSGSIQLNAFSQNIGQIVYTLSPSVGVQPSAGNFQSLPSGSYYITATDAGGCTTTTTVSVNYSSPPKLTNISTTDVICNGLQNGSFSFSTTGGTQPLTYAYNPALTPNAPGSFTGLGAGTYYVAVTDSIGCNDDATITISEPAPLVLTKQGFNTKCPEATNGRVELSATGGTGSYNYTLIGGHTTSSGIFDNLGVGQYFFQVTDNNNCIDTISHQMISYSVALATTIKRNESCVPGNDGQIIIQGYPVDTNYLYSTDSMTWSKQKDYTQLQKGTYQFFMQDPLTGCSAQLLDTLDFINNLPLNQVAVSDENCFKQNDGKITAPNTDYSYSLLPAAGNNSVPGIISNIPPGVYTLLGEKANGCTGEKIVSIEAADSLWIAYSKTSASNVHCYGSVDFEVAGGASNYTYSIQPKKGKEVSPGSYDGLCWGDYTIRATDDLGCMISKKIVIEEDRNAPRNMFHHFSIYPNPANDQLWLRSNYLFEYEVSLVNLTGQTLMEKDCYDKLTRIDVSNLAPGLYILRFNSDVDHFERKVLIQH